MIEATRWVAVFGAALFAVHTAHAHAVFGQPQAIVGKSHDHPFEAAASYRPAPAVRLVAAAGEDTAPKGTTSGPVAVERPWSRATPGGAKVAAGYLTIVNTGSSDDRLVSVTSDISGRGEVHEMAVKDGVMTMRAIDAGLPIPAGKSVALKPGSFHLMFQELKRPLKQGERFDATLTFEKAGPLKATFDVQGIGATAPAGAKSGNMPGMDMPMKH